MGTSHAQTRVIAPRIELTGVSKRFGTTTALARVDFELLPGEIHVLAGENGAGKSTLIKVLSGAYDDYAGELRVNGTLRRFRAPSDAAAAGIATIHQELSLVPTLSTVDNLMFALPGSPISPRARHAQREHAERVLSSVGLVIDPERPVEELGLSERQLIEIARALSRDARIFIMDEPTSALNEDESERLFSRIELLRERGAGILYISHRMDEIERLADRVTVLRDGQNVVTLARSELSAEALVGAMLGASSGKGVRQQARTVHAQPSQPLLEASALGAPEAALVDVSFALAPGEILGVAGLRGSGAGSLLRVLIGAGGATSGELRVRGSAYAPVSPRAALARGLAFVPGDRQKSVFPELRLTENATLSSLRRYLRGPFVDRRAEASAVSERASLVRLKAASLDARARTLSGGNQQKLALLRALLTNPRVLLLDDPTRGVDVAAKAEIHALLRELAAEGAAILLYASELEELVKVCDRVLVLSRGRLFRTLEGESVTRERLLAAVMGAAA